MKKSEKRKKLTEDFLAARGYRLTSLTSRQQQIVETCAGGERSTTYSIIMIAVLVILLVIYSLKDIRELYQSISFVNSKEIIFYAVITESDDRLIEPQQVKQFTTRIIELATISGARVATTFFLLAIIITAIVQNRERQKVIDAFLPKIEDSQDNTENEDT